MLTRRLALLTAALLGLACAAAPYKKRPAESAPRPPGSPESARRRLARLESEIARHRAALGLQPSSAPVVDGGVSMPPRPPRGDRTDDRDDPRCPMPCRHARAICRAARHICELADYLGEAKARARCARARAVCARAREATKKSCASCQR